MGALDIIEGASTKKRIGTRTTRVEISTANGSYTRVNEHPFTLADAANLDLKPSQPNLYSLARMIHAEEGNSDAINKACVCEAVINRAKNRKSNPYSVITFDLRRELWGWYGEQSGRYCASGGSLDPSEQDAEIAIALMNGELSFVKGAEKFFAPSIKTQKGKRLKSRERIVTDWAIEGFEWVGPIEGLDAGELMLLKNKGRHNASPRTALTFFKTRFSSDGENA